MALVLSHRPKSHAADPTAPLKQALTSFENILTEEQKQQYQANSIKPDASSVLTFVAEVDENNKSRGSRCVAPRLYTFLDAAQQFTGVVDTFISSNPAIAALVWGGVKMAVLTARNIASYFDKVTSLIMDIWKGLSDVSTVWSIVSGLRGSPRSVMRVLSHHYPGVHQDHRDLTPDRRGTNVVINLKPL